MLSMGCAGQNLAKERACQLSPFARFCRRRPILSTGRAGQGPAKGRACSRLPVGAGGDRSLAQAVPARTSLRGALVAVCPFVPEATGA